MNSKEQTQVVTSQRSEGMQRIKENQSNKKSDNLSNSSAIKWSQDP